MASNTPFPEFKTTGDEKHDLETYIEDLIDYCIMQNWYDTSKETDEAQVGIFNYVTIFEIFVSFVSMACL